MLGSDFRCAYHTDGYGFRNPRPWPEQAEILAFGDSVTFGYGVEDQQAWPAILARQLLQCHVLNLGLIGADSQQNLQTYETIGIKMHPRVVLVGLGLGGSTEVPRGKSNFSVRHPLDNLKVILSQHSYLYRSALAAYKNWHASPSPTLSFANGTQVRLSPERLVKAVAGFPEPQKSRLLQALEQIQSIARQNAVDVIVVFQPNKEEVYLPLLDSGHHPSPTAALGEALEKVGISFLDSTPAFRQRAMAGERLFFEKESYPNASGHALIAQVVLLHLMRDHHRFDLKSGPKE
jgi:hypothetical protein